MKVLLINPACKVEKALGRFQHFSTAMPPINLAYLASSLEKAGINVYVIDVFAEKIKSNAIYKRIDEISPEIIGIPCITQTAKEVYTLSKHIKENYPQTMIVLGNLHASLFADEILQNGLADIVVHGEGEKTLVDLTAIAGGRTKEQSTLSGGDFASVKGISFRDNGSIVTTSSQQFIENLDMLPFPAWRCFPLKSYELFGFASITKPGAIILGSRGCPFKCTFCSILTMGSIRRRRSPVNIAEEFEYLFYKFQYRQISFIDPIFPFHKDEGMEFCNELEKRKLDSKVVWTTETRVDLVDKELLKTMKSAGCRRIMYGFETGASEILSNLEKKFSLETAINAVKITKEAGMEIIGFFMLGEPRETKESMKATIQFAKKLDIDFAKFNIFVPYPGTPVYEMLKKNGRIETTDWDQFTSYPSSDIKPAYVPEKLTAEEMIYFQKRATYEFYFRIRIIFRHLFLIRTISLRDMFFAVLGILFN